MDDVLGREPHRGQPGGGVRVGHRGQVCPPRPHLHVGPQVSIPTLSFTINPTLYGSCFFVHCLTNYKTGS